MQAYATAEMAPSAELRVLDRRPAIPNDPSECASSANALLDQLVAEVAELVAEKVVARLVAPRGKAADEWMDTRRAAEYLGIHRDSLRRLAAEGSIAADRLRPAASSSSAGRIWTRGGVLELIRWSPSGAGAMANSPAAPRRTRVERAIYRRPTGVLEVCFKDESGRLRWRTVDGGILAARKLRDDLAGRRARGESVAPKPKLRFGEAADRWLEGPVLDLRDTTRVKYQSIVNEHLRPRFEARRLDLISADDLACLVRELRAQGKAEAKIAVVLGVVGRIYKFAFRRSDGKGRSRRR